MASDPTTVTRASRAVGASANLKNAHVWEVRSPLSLDPSGKGRHFVPGSITHGRRRRVSVEVHRVKSVFDAGAGGVGADGGVDSVNELGETEICYVRILKHREVNFKDNVLDPIAQTLKRDAKKVTKGTVNFFTGSLRPKDREAAAGDDDDSIGDDESFMRSFREPFTDFDASEVGGGDGKAQPFQGWQPKYKLPLRMFSVVEQKKTSVIVSFEAKGRSARREYIFEDERAVSEFCEVVKKNKDLLEGRTRGRIRHALGDIKLDKDERCTFLFDICSGSDLPAADITSESDPYVVVRFDGNKIHRTTHIEDASHPIWTLRTGSLFVWTVDATDLFRSEEGLIFEVKDYDSVGTNESLGAFNVNARTLYNWKGERREFALKPLLGEKDYGKGKIALRVRRATEHDVEFMEHYNAKKKSRASDAAAIALPTVTGAAAIKSIMTTHHKKEKEGPDKGKTKYLVRPGPDPKRKDDTAWLTRERIEEETLKPSDDWVDVGSGTLAKIFVEVLGCDKLPNMDTGGVLGNKTDAFVSLVYEDCFARTDVVSDCLSPRWMPWTRRAFVFNMMHTSSQLFLGVFDCDSGPLSSHDLIGRVSIDINNFRRNTVYLLQYNLYKTAKRGPREAKFGTIRLRMRLEPEPVRTLLLSNFAPPQSVYVNVQTKKDFEVIQETVEGGIDTRKYSLVTIQSFYDEIMSYLVIYYAMEDAFISLILWRSDSVVSLPMPSLSKRSMKWVEINFPLHSLLAFVCTVSLVENYNLLPSFFFGFVGWLLLVTVEKRSMNPNPWMRTKPFSHLLSALIMGKTVMTPQAIEAHQNVESIKETDTFWEKRVRDAEERAEKRAKEYAKEQEEYLKELEEIGDTNDDLSTPTSRGFGLGIVDPTRAYLLPLQQYLRITCIVLRVTKNILVWEECYISFWVATICLILSFVCFFVPWAFLVKWTLRIIVWTAFGPWMKLADIYYFSRLKEETDKEKQERMGKLAEQRSKRLEKQKLEAQITREKATKLKDFKQYLFGEHICRVNILKKDRYYDLPLPTSSSTSYNPESKTLGELAMQEAGYRRTRVEGQQLVGEMIPTIYETPTTEAPTGKPTKKTDLLEKGSPYDVDDSYSAAAIKVGSILLGAGAITWFVVPMITYLVRSVLPE